MSKQVKLGLKEIGVTTWQYAAFKAGQRAAESGMPVALLQSEAEKRARAYMKRAMKRCGITQAEGAKRALKYRSSFHVAALGTVYLQSRKTGDLVLEAEVLCHLLLR